MLDTPSKTTRNARKITTVEANLCPDLACRGAYGCRLDDYHVGDQIGEFGQRVLCPIHLVDFAERDVEET